MYELAVRVAVAEATGEEDQTDVGAARGRRAAARDEPHARAARRPPRARHPGPVRAAGARDRRGRSRRQAGGDPQVGDHGAARRPVQELEVIREEAEGILAEVAERGVDLDIPIGTMIELPRAALTAHQIAEAADFFSFGTNDLTQTTWGFSRDDVEAAFFAAYLEHGVFSVLPFETLDARRRRPARADRGREGRAARPDLKVGVCGEHGGDPESIHFFHDSGWTTSRARRSACRWRGWRPAGQP